MARVGDIVLGGRDGALATGAPIASAIAFELSSLSPTSGLYVSSRDWEVELRKGQLWAVARSSKSVKVDELPSIGLEQINRRLDLLSYEDKKSLFVRAPSEEQLMLFHRGRSIIIRHFAVNHLGIDISGTITMTDAEGNVVPGPAPAKPVWTPALRFYRQSQVSRDLVEAYRLLWLGFESLLSVVCPKAKPEREREWLTRALTNIGRSVDLLPFVPAGTREPIAFLVGTLYEFIRLRLFHAKVTGTRRSEPPDPEKLAIAYERLLRIWREVAGTCLSIRPGTSSGMTYGGFEALIEGALVGRAMAHVTDDEATPSRADTVVSPNGRRVWDLGAAKYLGETAPGRHSFLASYEVPSEGDSVVVFRIAMTANATLMSVSGIQDGVTLDGADSFESYQTFRLVNRGLPRLVFGED